MTKTLCLSTAIFLRIFFLFLFHFVSQSLPIRRNFLRHLVSIADSAQCNRKSAICGLQIRSGQRSAFLVLTKRKAGSGDEIVFRSIYISFSTPEPLGFDYVREELWTRECLYLYLKNFPQTQVRPAFILGQSVEHETLNLRVVGSSPTLGTKLFSTTFFFPLRNILQNSN